MNELRGIADKFAGTNNFRFKFKAVPWLRVDGKAFPDGQHIAFTHWSIGGADQDPTGDQAGRRLAVLLGGLRRRPQQLHARVPLHGLPRAQRHVMTGLSTSAAARRPSAGPPSSAATSTRCTSATST